MKKFLCLLLALCLLVGCLPVTTGARGGETVAYPVTGGNIYFCNGVITDCDDTVTAAEIPAEIEGQTVETIGDSAFYNCSSLTSVTIPNCVTKVEMFAFGDCSKLEQVTLPNSVKEVGYRAFYRCVALSKITLSNQLSSIEGALFYRCEKLVKITIPDSVTSIGYCAFDSCSGLTSVTIPNSVTSIERFAFRGCSALTSITIPNSVTSIGYCAFDSCSGLTSVTIPDSVTSIEGYAFRGCSGLTSVTIPDSVTSIEGYAFRGCSGLTSVTIPDSITSIEYSAFSDCSSLTSVTIPDSVTGIGRDAFHACTSLTSITIPNSVTEIGDFAFDGCSSLTSVTFLGDAPCEEFGSFNSCAGNFRVYYNPYKTGWTTPNWNGYPCFPMENPPTPTPTPTPTPGGNTPSAPSDDEPIVETSTTESGNLVTTTTQPNGDQELKVETPTGETIANIKLLADPGKGKEFADVKPGAWYEGAVDKATAYGLFGGTSETTFAPGAEMTRGMLAQVLYNLSGKTQYGVGEGTFTDVRDGAWYQDAVDWAAKVSVTSGTGNGGFSPNQSITREQLVTMLYNYAKAIGMDTTESTQIDSFPDGKQVNDWAQVPMQWAVAKGFINGRANDNVNYIAPQGTATRAEVAAVLVKFTERLKK